MNEPLGRGAFATVRRERDPATGAEVAVKELRPDRADAAAKAMLAAEARVLRELPPGIGPALLAAEEGRLVLELVPGRDFAGVGPASPGFAAEAAVALASVLKALHAAGFVHGDVSPSHAILTPDRTVRLVDFGLAHRIGGAPSAAPGGAGTPAYVSPEAAAGRFGDPRSDLYSAGAVLYELLTGSPPFAGPEPADALLRAAARAPEPPSRLAPSVPAVLDQLVLRLLHPDPAKRFPDAAAFEAAARKAAGSLQAAPRRRGTGPIPAGAAAPSPEKEAAEVLLDAGRFAEAREAAENALRALPPSSPMRLSRLLLLARAFLGEGRFPSAEEAIGALLLEASSAGDAAALGRAHRALGELHLERRDFRGAARNLEKAAAAGGEGRDGLQARLLLARARMESGDLAAAAGEALRARELAGRLEAPEEGLLARVLEAEGMAARGDPGRALESLGRLLRSSREAGPPARGRVRMAVGRAFRLGGDPARARRHFAGAAGSFRKGNQRLPELSALLQAALAAAFSGKPEEAGRSLARARAVFGTIPPGGLRRLAAAASAAAALERGDPAAARASLEEGERAGGRPEDDPAGGAAFLQAASAAAFGAGEAAAGVEKGRRALALLEGDGLLLERALALSYLAARAHAAPGGDPRAAAAASSWAAEAAGIWREAGVPAAEGLARILAREAAAPVAEEEAEEVQASSRGAGPAGEGPAGGPSELQDLRAQRGSLLTLARISKTINSELDLARLVPLIMDMAVEAVKAERGFLLLRKGEGFAAEVARTWDRAEVGRPEFEVSRSIAEEVVRSGTAVLTEDAGADGRFQDRMSVVGLRLRSVLCVPFRRKGETVGAVYVEDRRRAGAFGAADMDFLSAFADQAAVALENARLYEELREKARLLEASKREVEGLNRELEEKVRRQADAITEMEQRMEAERVRGRFRYDYRNIVGRSEAMQEVFRLLDRVTDSAVPVLVVGESGTGKELVARAIHFNGPRQRRPFAAENCAALAEPLLESELFGHVRGAFTGAVADRKGLFELADGGTLFLDEVGEMSPGMQAKLLRVLQDGEFRPVGGKSVRKADVRLIAASNRDLRQMVAEGKFREDLFYRVNVLTVILPPLRKRLEDIPLLVEKFLEAEKAAGRGPFEVSAAAMKRLLAHGWPGNVRELENEVRRAAALSDGAIGPEHLSPGVGGAPSAPPEAAAASAGPLKEEVDALETRLIREALARHGGNKTKAAQALGLSRFGLQKKMNRLGL